MILAQEMRPQTFDEVIGNAHIVEPLRKQLAAGKLSQSLMITGATGTGKTSIALIVGKELDAEIVEVDCGSEGGIDVIRGVIESSTHTSLFSSSKVFILDEAHKLSNPSQSALLKTLETSQPGIYFILLTNEPSKVLKTIRTRCAVYETHLPTTSEIGVAVNRVLDTYGLSVENRKDFWSIVEQSEGSLRQVYALMEKLIAVADEDGFITSEAFNLAVGAPDSSEGNENNVAKLFLSPGNSVHILAGLRDIQRKGGVVAHAQALGVYNYLKSAYLGGNKNVNPRVMLELSSLFSSGKTIDWVDLERIVWVYVLYA